jgi:acyl-CoA reductase-like NAD-dependent aldehyde dehydrogenase
MQAYGLKNNNHDTRCHVDQEGGHDMKSAQIDVKEYSYFVDNQWREAADKKFFEVHEPYSGKLFARVAAGSRADGRTAVDAAAKAFAGWAETTPAEKARLFLKAAEIVKRGRSEIAEVLARETGSTISFATFQQDLVAATLQQVHCLTSQRLAAIWSI